MKIDEIEHWAGVLRRNSLEELEISDDEQRLLLVAAGPVQASIAPVKAAPQGFVVRAPDFGIFRRVHPLRSDAETHDGQDIKAGALLGYVDVEGGLVAIRADRAGRVREVLPQDGALIGYGDPVIRLD